MTDVELRSILDRDVLEGARSLLGWILVRGAMKARIVETEAYRAEDDPACHGYRGPTPRNQVLFERAGIAYVYFNYGVHWMLNVSAHEYGRGAGILIRAAEPLEGLEEMRFNRGGVADRQLLSGPGKLAKAFGVTGEDNGIDLLDPGSTVRIVPGHQEVKIVETTRIGIAEGKGHELQWRYLDGDRLEWCSRRPR